jgi:hypothetical protein
MLALCDRVAVFESGGRLVACRPPTLETVETFLWRFDGLIAAALAALPSATLTVEAMQHMIALCDVRSDDLAFCLSTCCTIDSGGRARSLHALRQNRDLRRRCALEVITLCDLEAITRSFGSGVRAAPSSRGSDNVVKMVCVLAERFGVSPLEVVRWPYEAVLAVIDALSEMAAEQRESVETGGMNRRRARPIDIGMSRDELAALGVTVFAPSGRA